MRSRVLSLLLSVLAVAVAGHAQRGRYNFNRDWLLRVGDPSHAEQPEFNDAGWKHVTLPHAWNEDSAYRVSIHDLPTGIAWYRKHFCVTTAPGDRVLIEFEGVRQAAEVFLNGHRATAVSLLRQLHPVEGGINRVSIRSTTVLGTITLSAAAEGLATAHLRLILHAVPDHNGLSTYDPAATLPVDLERGPTPSTPSFHVTRVPIAFASATAGANAQAVALSYDDNEASAWSNAAVQDVQDAALSDAWIEYTFAAPAKPYQLERKLTGFRERRYPLRVTLDGAVVYAGTTPTSLGYVTLPLTVTKPGTHLRIQLTAPPFQVKEAHSLVELNGTVDQAAPEKTATLPPVLSVIEAEVYKATNGR